MKAIALVQTCIACPAQWEGTLEDGRMFYVRYRFGHFRLYVSEYPTDNVKAAIEGILTYDVVIGDDFDGYMDTTNMQEITKDYIDWETVKNMGIGVSTE